VAVEADHTVAVHPETEPGAPPQPVGVARHRLHLDAALDSCKLAQELGDAGFLQAPLGPELHVLEVAAATAAGSGVGTGRRHTRSGARATHPPKRRATRSAKISGGMSIRGAPVRRRSETNLTKEAPCDTCC